jgi:hypothetical protein
MQLLRTSARSICVCDLIIRFPQSLDWMCFWSVIFWRDRCFCAPPPLAEVTRSAQKKPSSTKLVQTATDPAGCRPTEGPSADTIEQVAEELAARDLRSDRPGFAGHQLFIHVREHGRGMMQTPSSTAAATASATAAACRRWTSGVELALSAARRMSCSTR